MNKSALNFVAGVLVGIVGIVCWEVVRGEGAPMEVDNSVLERNSEATIELLKEISYKLERQNEYIAFLPVGEAEETEEGSDEENTEPVERVVERVIVPPKVAAATVSKAPDASWVSVLDKDLAKVLVENGLTPFDKGVALPLLESAKEIREIYITYNKEMEEHKERYKGMKYSSKDDPIYIEYSKIREKKDRGKRDAVESFRVKIASLFQ